MEREKEDHKGKVADMLTSIKRVNKTDSQSLLDNFGSVRNIIKASMADLSMCPGLGEKKVRGLFNAFRKPFIPVANDTAKASQAPPKKQVIPDKPEKKQVTTDKSGKKQVTLEAFAEKSEKQSLKHVNEDEADDAITFDQTRKKKIAKSDEE
eukprot:TRINITY_DN10787_c0_g1_i1.p1 TRINITY_DN10787_c0_g1~~TRINITY_DN10787_c0_g1_i1.p1  ORF type:complete len:152 (+),score=41.14 TRINITY_DN10787_c0_g1_i1:240-695(+)